MTAERPSVSVVISCYNYENYVGAAIESALEQGDVEVIVVDDGSTDGSRQVIETYAAKITMVNKENGGQGSAFNAAAEYLTGEIVAFLDADDLLAAGAIERIQRAAITHPDAVLFLHPLEFIDHDGAPLVGGLPESVDSLPHGDLRERMLSAPDDIPWQPTSGLATRTSALQQVLPIPEETFTICADAYMVNSVPLYGKVHALRQTGAFYRRHGENQYFRQRLDVERLAQTNARTSMTHSLLRDRAIELGLRDDPQSVELLSVTNIASRLLVFRLQPELQPSDTKFHTRYEALRLGLRATRARPETPIVTKLGMASWFVAASFAPRRLVPALGEIALRR